MAETGAPPSHSRAESESEFARIVAFTDGVMSIAITLLVLNIEVPNASDAEVLDQLTNLWPALLSYAISFLVIGRFWLAHHSFFGSLSGFDTRLMSLNLFYLSLIVLIPFTTDVLDSYTTLPPAPILYGVVIAGVSAVGWLMNRHALRAGLVREERLRLIGGRARLVGLVPAGIFLASIPFAFFYPAWTPAVWAIALIVSGRKVG